jgi:hypothetical protein
MTACNCTGDNSTIKKGPKNNRKVPVRIAVGENCFKLIIINASSFRHARLNHELQLQTAKDIEQKLNRKVSDEPS